MTELTQARLKELLAYNPETGEFARHGKRCGGPDVGGYILISVDGARHKAHRLAFLFMLGRWPEGDVDHANRNTSDNRWSNLREATRAQNCANAGARSNSKSGVRGVCLTTRGWKAQIKVSGKNNHLGYFGSAEAASAAYKAAAQRAFGQFAA